MTTKPRPTKAELLKRLKKIEAKENAVLTQMVSYRTDNLIEFFDRPNPLQAKLLKAWEDPSYKVFTFTGGNRIGKTTIGGIIAIATCIGFYPWNGQELIFPHRKPRKIRYIGQDWERQIKAVVIPELEKWWPKKRLLKKKKNSIGIEATWKDEKTGSTIEVLSNGQDSELHEGWSGDLIIYDEPPKRDIRVANARGLIDRKGRELFCMTLLKEAWVDREVIKAVNEDTGRPDLSVFNVHGDIYENIGYGITKEGVRQFAKTLTEDEKDARLRGIPSYMSGLVYPKYDRATHLVERFQIPLDWIVDVAIDIHPRAPQAILFCATAPNGARYLINEIWAHGDGTWVGQEIVRCARMSQYRIGTIIVDPLAKGDSNNPNTVFDKIAWELWQYGHTLNTASKDKNSGILEVKKHLHGPNQEPSIYIFDDMVRTIMEIEGYMYDKETQKPKKEDDHMMENLYRLLLLNTEWTPVDRGSEESEYDRDEVGAGGY